MVKLGELLQSPLELFKVDSTYRFCPDALARLVISMFLQHSLKLKTQSLQFCGRVKVPWYSYISTPGLLPPLHVLNAVGQSGDISIPGPVEVNVVLPLKPHEMELILMITDVGAAIPPQSL